MDGGRTGCARSAQIAESQFIPESKQILSMGIFFLFSVECLISEHTAVIYCLNANNYTNYYILLSFWEVINSLKASA